MKRNRKRCVPALLLALVLFVPAAAAAGMPNFQKAVEYPGFSDLAGTEWFAANVKQVCELGIMNGRGSGIFAPYKNLTLGEAVTMAAKTRDIYLGGGTFTPGGSPWYQNAVDYALEEGMVLEGEYADYAALATRADMINLFAWALPSGEYNRINRVSSIPDVDANTRYVDEIFLLYGAGILTGSTDGACLPYENVTRCEAAAIISRVALTANRKIVTSLSSPTPGKLVSSYDGSFHMVMPTAGWQSESLTNEQLAQKYQLFLCATDGSAAVIVQSFPKSGITAEGGLYGVTVAISDAVLTSLDSVTDDSGLRYTYIRGYEAYSQSFFASDQGETTAFWMCYLENSENYYIITLCVDGAGSACESECFDILYTFDAEL